LEEAGEMGSGGAVIGVEHHPKFVAWFMVKLQNSS
jgi:hypothetical protein